jgi:phosphopantothenoylcysteine decarboxylase / phosphopantothenate---cysteine ligase
MQFNQKNFYIGKKVLITLGSTREHLDPVRFLSNASSGKMGLALAREFRARNAKVFLISGPGISADHGFPSCSVISAREMLSETVKRFPSCDLFISTAAVADFRPSKQKSRKIHKTGKTLQIRLISNPDILKTVTRKKTKQFCVGFALEDSNPVRNAQRKMKEKKCDLMILNSPKTIGSNSIEATLLDPEGNVVWLGNLKKEECAKKICLAIMETIKRKSSTN